MDGSQLSAMQCPGCNAKNPEGARSCDECASPLPVLCPKCRASNRAGANFCNACATPLTSGAPTPSPADSARFLGGVQRIDEAASAATRPGPVGERRHLTVMFCDLVGSTEISSQLDPEEWRGLVSSYHRAATAAVERYGGHVAQYLGDGVLVYFGWPQAHEDDAERAVHAGLAIVEAMVPLNTVFAAGGGTRLAVRVGMHTGPVVIADGGEVFGETPNIAARVQSATEPDTVVITAATQRLVVGMFVVENRGPHVLKGVREAVTLYHVVQPSLMHRRGHRSDARALTPFVGREDELRLVLSRWERAREGEGQLALVVGEPGIGKSRLVEEFGARIKDDPHLWIECAGEQFSANTPFHAVTQILDQGLGWRGGENKEERTVLLERSLERSGMKLGEAVPLIAEILNLPIPQKYPPLMFAPDQKRRRLLANLVTWVLNLARLLPVVIAMEDLHWVGWRCQMAGYAYDNDSHVTGITYSMSGNQVSNLNYSYDSDGRVTRKTESLSSTGMPSAVTGNTFNADNAMTGFNGATLSYDANGNLTSDGTNTYTWDARNHLTAISGGSTASFAYDALGRRAQKIINGTSTQFLYDRSNPVQELQGGTPSANLLTGLGIDERFQRTDSAGPRDYLIDILGNTLALTDSSGTIQTSYTYEPFGNTTTSGASSTNPYQFTGREDDVTGSYFYRARYYSPTFQRFIAQDPRVAARTLNIYVYALNDPVGFADPLGLFPWPIGLPPNILLGGGNCGFVGGLIDGVTGGFFFGPGGAIIGAIGGNLAGQLICNDPCAGALNCGEDQMLPPPSCQGGNTK